MFGKKCPNCRQKVGKNFSFCPFCGQNLKEESKRNDGLLGEIDESFGRFEEIKLPFGFNMLFNKLTKEIDKQLREFDKAMGGDKLPTETRKKIIPLNRSGISISISSASGKEPVIKVRTAGIPAQKGRLGKDWQGEGLMKEAVRIQPQKLTRTQETKLASLPRQEPETKVRRLTNKIVYEIDLPGVKDKKDIIINQLDNSIEIKAISKDKAFFKLIPVSLPLSKHSLKDGKLILELKPED